MDRIALLIRRLTPPTATGALDGHSVLSAANCFYIFGDFHLIKL